VRFQTVVDGFMGEKNREESNGETTVRFLLAGNVLTDETIIMKKTHRPHVTSMRCGRHAVGDHVEPPMSSFVNETKKAFVRSSRSCAPPRNRGWRKKENRSGLLCYEKRKNVLFFRPDVFGRRKSLFAKRPTSTNVPSSGVLTAGEKIFYGRITFL